MHAQTQDALRPVSARRPFVVGIGGSTRAGSSTERALEIVLQKVERGGGRTRLFNGADLLALPIYAPEDPQRTPGQRALVEAVRTCDALVIGSPGYHGSISGLVKNALDLLEDLRDDRRPYLDGRAVGCVVTAYGWQAAVTTLGALRAIVHGLRGWPTPYGATLNVADVPFGPSGEIDDRLLKPLGAVAAQIIDFRIEPQAALQIA